MDLSLIVPIYNSAPLVDRLLTEATAWIRSSGRNGQLLVVDDGSNDDTWERLRRGAASAPQIVSLLRHSGNQGKGAAVRHGMLQAAGRVRIFMDADLAYPMPNVGHILASIEAGADVAVGCRTAPGSRFVIESGAVPEFIRRHRAGRSFNRLVAWILLPGLQDTQAGLKGFTAAAAQAVFSRTELDRFAFDVEVLFIARRLGFTVREVPVEVHCHAAGSSVRLGADSIRMLRDILRTRWRWRRLQPEPRS